jgi:hypothetical protein
MVVGVTTRVDQPNARTGPSDDIRLCEGGGSCPLGSVDRLWRISQVVVGRLSPAGLLSLSVLLPSR